MSKLNVYLDEEQSESLKAEVYGIILNAIDCARRDASIDQQYIRRKDAIKYAGVSGSTFDKWKIVPHVISEGIVLYSKKDIQKFIELH